MASLLPLLSEAASASNAATELPQQQQLHEDQHQQDEAHFSEDPVGSQEQQNFSDPSQHWHDESLQQEHHHEDLFEPASMQRGSSINNTTPMHPSTNFSTSADPLLSFNNTTTIQEQQ